MFSLDFALFVESLGNNCAESKNLHSFLSSAYQPPPNTREKRKISLNCSKLSEKLNETRKILPSLRCVFFTFAYLAIVCLLEAQHKKFIRRLFAVKACCECVSSFGNLLYKEEKKRKEYNFNAIPKNFPGTVSSESFPHSAFAESLSGRREEKVLL